MKGVFYLGSNNNNKNQKIYQIRLKQGFLKGTRIEKPDNMEQVQMEYWEMDIQKVNEFNYLNEKVEEFTSRWSQSLVNVRIPSYLKQNSFKYCSWGIKRLYIQFLIWTW